MDITDQIPTAPTPQPTLTPLPTITPAPSHFPLILMIILFFVSSAAAIYFYLQTKLPPQNTSVSASPTPVASTDPTESWKEYSIAELNLQFKLPLSLAQYGDFRLVSTPSESGNQDCWSLGMPQGSLIVNTAHAGGGSCGLYALTIGRTSVDHEAGRMGGFADYKIFAVNSAIPKESIKQFTNSYGVEIIRIIGTDSDGFPTPGTPGSEGVGAIIKTTDSKYQVITVQMKLNDDLNQKIFDQILSTFKFTN